MARRALLVLVALLALVALSAPGTAGAVTNPDYTESPPPTTVVTTPGPPAARQPVSTSVRVAPLRTRLAITGRDTMVLAGIGVAMVAAGAVVLGARRRSLSAAGAHLPDGR